MKKKYGKRAAVAVLAAVLLLSGCGRSASSSSGGASYNAKEEMSYAAAEEAADYDYAYQTESAEMEASASAAFKSESGAEDNGSALRAQDGQKIVYTGELSIQSLEYDKSAAGIRAKIKQYGGFSESESESDKDYYWYSSSSSSGNTRNLSITARIPSENFEAFMNSLEGEGKVMSRSMNAQNISQVYASKENYKQALEKEQSRLLEMMDKAGTIEEMIAVESRLSDVERQLNSYKTDLSAMDKDVQYSTIYINLKEVKRYTETVDTTTFGEKIRFAFEDAINNFTGFCQNVILFVVGNFPFLILFAILLVILFRWFGKRRAQKIALLTNPEYAKVMTAKVQAKAEAAARKQAAKEARRQNRGGIFGKKNTEPQLPAEKTDDNAAKDNTTE